MNKTSKVKTDYVTIIRGPCDEKYQITEVGEDTEDDMYVRPWSRKFIMLLPLTAAAAVISGYTYWRLQFRLLLSLRASGHNMNGRLIFSLVDLLCTVPTLMKAIMDTIALITPLPRRPSLRLRGNSAPTVDIIITSCNEDADVILDTARAAMNVDYPKLKFRVIVTDDGACADLKAGIEKLALRDEEQRLFYTSRIKGLNDRHKAGNLNHALRFTLALPNGASEFTAGLDADMIPERNFLRAQIPHLILDPKLGFTCPAATFYNNSVNDPLLQSQTVINKYEEFAKDRVNAAWCTGSGWIMRRCALDQLGGFPMSTIAEDVHCSNGISNLGWNAAFIPESLQFGLVPDSYHGHLKQHRRWKLGGLQIGLAMNFGLFGKQVSGMTLTQRSYWFFYPFKAITSTFITLGLFTAPFLMICDIPWVVYPCRADLKPLVQRACISFMCSWLLRCHIGVLTGYKASLMELCNDIWMTPYHTVTQFQTYILPKWLGGKFITFIPTGSIPNELQERSKTRRPPLYHRLRSILFKEGAIFHLVYVTSCMTSVPIVIGRAYIRYPEDTTGFRLYLLTHIGWIPLPWCFAAAACLQPIRYAIFPPNVPDREDLLERDPVTGVAYPIKTARRVVWKKEWFGYQNLYIVVAIYCISLLYSTLRYQW